MTQRSREPEEIVPFSMSFAYPGDFDFRGPVPANEPEPGDVLGLEDVDDTDAVDPKDSSALESVESSKSQTTAETESSASQEPTAPVEKVSTPPKGDESTGTPIF